MLRGFLSLGDLRRPLNTGGARPLARPPSSEPPRCQPSRRRSATKDVTKAERYERGRGGGQRHEKRRAFNGAPVPGHTTEGRSRATAPTDNPLRRPQALSIPRTQCMAVQGANALPRAGRNRENADRSKTPDASRAGRSGGNAHCEQSTAATSTGTADAKDRAGNVYRCNNSRAT